MLPPPKIVVREPTEAELPALMAKMGLAALPIKSCERLLAKSISTRMCNRQGASIYQTAAYNQPLFPRSVAESLFRPSRRSCCRPTRRRAC